MKPSRRNATAIVYHVWLITSAIGHAIATAIVGAIVWYQIAHLPLPVVERLCEEAPRITLLVMVFSGLIVVTLPVIKRRYRHGTYAYFVITYCALLLLLGAAHAVSDWVVPWMTIFDACWFAVGAVLAWLSRQQTTLSLALAPEPQPQLGTTEKDT